MTQKVLIIVIFTTIIKIRIMPWGKRENDSDIIIIIIIIIIISFSVITS